MLGSNHSLAPVASSTKFATVFGAWFGNNSITILPMLVFNVAVLIFSLSVLEQLTRVKGVSNKKITFFI